MVNSCYGLRFGEINVFVFFLLFIMVNVDFHCAFSAILRYAAECCQ